MPHVATVAALEVRDPVASVVLAESHNLLLHGFYILRSFEKT